jgi:hypothetical protein
VKQWLEENFSGPEFKEKQKSANVNAASSSVTQPQKEETKPPKTNHSKFPALEKFKQMEAANW